MDGILSRLRRRNQHRRSDHVDGLPTHQTDLRESLVLRSSPIISKSIRQKLEPLASEKDAERNKRRQMPTFSPGIVFSVVVVVLGGLILFLTSTTAIIPTLVEQVVIDIRAIYQRFFWTVQPDTFTYECRHHYLYNDTFGRIVAPFVDKHQAKDLVKTALRAEGRESLVKLPRTLALYDQSNISLFTTDIMLSLPQPYLIKPTHTSGGIASIMNDTYECFKNCHFRNEQRISPLQNAFATSMKNVNYNLRRHFSTRETQYQHMPPRVIIEEHLPLDGLREFNWFTVNGRPVFARSPCVHSTNVTYYSAGFGELLGLGMWDWGSRCEEFKKPGAFSKMMEAVRVLGQQFPGIVRIDLYVNDVDVYFGEFTFSTNACKIYFRPIVADRLLYALLHGDINPSKVTPEFVERLINEKPWFLVNLNNDAQGMTYDAMTAFSSKSDLCDKTDAPTASCLDVSETVRSLPLRCILVEDQDVTALGQEKLPSLSALMRSLEIPFVLGTATILAVMICLNLGSKPTSRLQSNAYFLLAVTVYNYLKPNCESLVSRMPLFVRIVRRTFQAFELVHPVENSRILAVGHYATYWFAVAAWRAKTPRRMLFWWFLYMVLAQGVNEYLHHRLEAYDEIRCARLSFMRSMEHYAVDETIRKYILPPFFVYGYLFPKQLLCGLGLVECSSSGSVFETLYKYY